MTRILIHKVVEGPFYDTDEDFWVLIVKAQEEGEDEIYQDALISNNEDDHWEIVRHLNHTIFPFVIDLGEEENIGEN